LDNDHDILGIHWSFHYPINRKNRTSIFFYHITTNWRINLNWVITTTGITNSIPINRFRMAEIWIFPNEDGPALQFHQRFQSNFLFGCMKYPMCYRLNI
jgi:hypothetical protein